MQNTTLPSESSGLIGSMLLSVSSESAVLKETGKVNVYGQNRQKDRQTERRHNLVC